MNELSLRVFRAAEQPLDRSWQGRDRSDGYWRLYRNDSAGAWVESDGRRLKIVENYWFLIPDLCRFDYGLEAPIPNHFYVEFDVPGVAGWALREALGGPLLLPPTSNFDPFATVWEEAENWASRLQIHALVAGILALALQSLPEIRREHWNSLSNDTTILPALEYIESHPDKAPSNDELAKLCHLSKAHFIRRFRAATRRTPQTYLARCRVALAAQKLAFSNDSIDSIAHDLGFANRFYFSRVFAQHMGAAPAAYRQRALG